jgi:hypothetical protein
MKHVLGLLAAFLLGCTGSVETSADSAGASGTSASTGAGVVDPCAIPTAAFDSNTAVAQVRCLLPTYTKLGFLWSSSGGDLDALGRSSQWNLDVLDDTAGLRVRAGVTVSNGVVTESADPTPNKCPGNETILRDTTVVVPDAIERFAKHDPYVGGYTNYFWVQAAPCPIEDFKGYAKVVIRRPDPSLIGMPDGMPHLDSWYAHYDAASKFVKLCGPCSGAFSNDDDCSTCFD